MKTLKQAKYDLVLENIKTLMLEKSMFDLSISDIAKALEIGEATIYRYFGTRVNLVIEAGISLWKDIYQALLKKKEQTTGFLSLRTFFDFFLTGYKDNQKVFVFLKQFDNLMVVEHVDKQSLKAYDKVLADIKHIYDQFYEQGLQDGSINPVDQDKYYYTTTHMILGICYRLAGNGNILNSDEIVDEFEQIELALDMCLEYIRRK